MKKKRLVESLNRYFSAEEQAIRIPPIEDLKAYGELQAPSEPPAREARRSVRSVRRVVMVAACLAVVVAVAILLPAAVHQPEGQEDPASWGGGYTDKDPSHTTPSPNGGAQEELKDQTSGSAEAVAPDIQEEPDDSDPFEESNGEENEPGEVGSGESRDRFVDYFHYKFYRLDSLSYLVTWKQISAAKDKVFVETSYAFASQLPPLYLLIRELKIDKEAFLQVRDEHFREVYTDEEIDWLFSDADVRTIQAALKLDTALLYEDILYNPYELLRMEDPQWKELAGTEEMSAYLQDLDAYLEDLEYKAQTSTEPNTYDYEWKKLNELVNQLKAKLEGTV